MRTKNSRLAATSSDWKFPYLLVRQSQTWKQKVVFFNVLCAEQTFFSPEIPIRGMLVTLYQKQRRWKNSFCMNELPGGSDWFVFATFNAELRHILKNPSSLLPTTAFALASPCQSPLPPFSEAKCSDSYKRRRKYIDLAPKFQLLLTQRYKD